MSIFRYEKITKNIHLLVIEGDREAVNIKAYYTAGGSWFEEKTDAGKKHLLEHCIVARTKDMNHEEFKNFERKNGITINAFTSPLRMGLEISGHNLDFELMLDTISECLFTPTFDQEDLDREKQIVIREISERRGDPSYKLYYDTLNAVFEPGYQNHETLGDPELVANTTIEDFIKLNTQSIKDGHIVFTIDGGNVSVEKSTEIILKHYEKLPDDLKEPAKYPVNYLPKSIMKEFKTLGYQHPLAHEHVDLTFYIPMPLTVENLAVRTVFNNLYLQYGGILYDRLRDESQLVYGISPYFDTDTGHLCINLTCEEKYINEIIKQTTDVFEDFDRYFDETKFDDYISSAPKKQAIAKDNLHKMINFTGNILMQYGKVVTMDDHINNLKNVTKENLRALFNQIRDGFINKKTLLVSKNKSIEKYTIK